MKRKALLLLMLLAMGAPSALWAAELTVHDGTATSGYVPVYGYYCDAYLKCEMVYPASELSNMANKYLYGMKFYASQTSVSWGNANFQVFLKEVSSASISSFSGPGTEVYNGSLSIDGNGMMVVTFTTNFYYSGGNLLVGIYNTTTGSYVTSTWYGETVNDASVQGYSYSSLSSVSPTQRNFLPKTTFTYSNTLTLNVNNNTGGTVSGGGLCTPNYWYRITATPASGYRFLYWKENGSVVNSDVITWVHMTSDRTITAYFEPIYTNTASASPTAGGTVAFGSYTYNFDDHTTQGWTNIDADGDLNIWNVYSTGIYDDDPTTGQGHNSSDDCMSSGSFSNLFGEVYSPDNYLVSPKVQLGGSISFYAKNASGTYPEQIAVAVSTSGNTSASDFTTISSSIVTLSGSSWTQYTVSLSGYSGAGYVAIRHYGTSDQLYLLLDDITIVPGSGTSVSGTFCQNQSCSATATANSGYGFYRWSNGTTSTTTTFNVSAATTLTANFGPSVITMECGQTVSGTLGTSGVWGTGSSPYNMSSSWGVGGEAVYAFTPSLTGTHTIACNTTSGDPDFWVLSDYNPQTAIYSSGGGNISASLEAGHTYYIVADNYSSSNTAGYSIQVICPEPPLDVVVGSNGGTSNGSYLPVHFFYNNSLTQQIYTPEEIGYTGTIQKLSFYYNTGTSETRTITVYMKNTSTKTLSSFDSSPGTVVYNGSYTFSGTGWQTITLSTAFNYSSVSSNLMITVDMNGTYSSSHSFATYSTGENRALYTYDDNTNFDATSPPSSASTSQYNNYIKLYMENPTQYKFVSATVNGVGSVSYSPYGTTTPKGSHAYFDGASLTLSASAGTNFTFSNWTENGSVVSTSASYNFTVSANRNLVANFAETPATLPYTETFESNTWPMVNGDRTNKWYRGAAGARNGSYGLFISNDGSNNTYNPDVNGAVWAYKTINFSETADYAISFDWRAEGESSWDYILVGLVPASTTLTDGSDFSTPSGWIDLNGGSYLNQQKAWQRKTTIQNVTAGNYKLAFCWRNDGSGGYDPPAAIDNIEVRKALTVAVSAGTGGSVSGSGSFALNQRCTVTATPNSNYCFANWTEGGSVVSSNPTYTFDVTANRTLVANFVSADNITVSGTTTVNCGNTTTLTASGLTGVTYEWYSDASCTNLVATGTTLTTPALSDNTTYYVKAVKESVREQYSTFDYTGGSQSYSIPSGASALKMEVWGAQGGGRQVDGNSNGGYGGNGGYSVGTLTNLSGVSSIYVYVGGQGETSMRQSTTAASGGWNGGGTAFASDNYDPACGGGGATDIRVGGTSLYYRIMVAGGGGGGGEDGEQGGYGGGTTGGAGSSSGTTGGTQTGGGTGYAFGIGASTQYDGGAGGGGWYGGGCGGGTQTIPTENSGSDSQGGCGGSGYVWTSSTASSAPSGYSVSSSYYLSDAQTIGGGSSMPNPFGGTMTGNQSNGYARITAIFNEVCETEAKAVTITVDQPAAPTNLQVSNITTTTATVSWSGTTGSYEYSINNGSSWIPTNSTSVNLTGLTAGTQYTFQVKALSTGTCESNVVSTTFTTLQQYTVSASASPTEGGTVTGAGTYNYGASATLTATPGANYRFVNWTEGGNEVSTSATYSFTVNSNRTLVANFELATVTITKEIIGNQGNNDHWYLITSPLKDPIEPGSVANMVANPATNYDLYSFLQNPQDGLEWRNFKDGQFSTLVAGTGYLYSNYNTVTLTFMGVPYQGDGVVATTNAFGGGNWEGWNLVGNPFNLVTYLDVDFYRMNAQGTEILLSPVDQYDDMSIAPMEGVFVNCANSNGRVTFSPEGSKSARLSLNITQERGVVDCAAIRFDRNLTLPKLQLNPSHTKVYIPQDDKDYAVVYAGSHIGEIPVSFKAEKNGTYTLSVNAREVSFGYLHLIDNKTGKDIDLLTTPSYTFDALTMDYAHRFKLVFATGGSDDEFAFYHNGSFVISNEGEAVLQVVDVTGRILRSERISGCAHVNFNAAAGVYMLRLVNGDNVKVQKVVVR